MNEEAYQDALSNPRNVGEMSDADAVGTVGNPDCGDMLRMWIKFREENGRKVIDRASFQSFGCQTAIAVASMATEMLKGRTVEEARALDAAQLGGELGPLPPMKMHCGQLVEGALRNALDSGAPSSPAQEPGETPQTTGATLAGDIAKSSPPQGGRLRIVPLDKDQ